MKELKRNMLLLERLTKKKVIFINENSEGHSYGCVMLFFDFDKLKPIQNKIEKEDLYEEEPGFGLEKDPHLTLLYGLYSNKIKNDENVFDTVLNFDIPKLELYNISLFKNKEYEVLKFDVKQKMKEYSKKDDILYKINKKLTERFPYKETYPDYHPHSTIAYLKLGKGKKYVDMFKDKVYQISPRDIVYSKSDGKKKEKSILAENKSKYLKIKDHIAKMHIPSELKEKNIRSS